MGKRKRRLLPPPIAHLSLPAADSEPCSSAMKRSSTEEPPEHIRIAQPHSSSKVIIGSHEEQNDQISISHHQHNHHHHHHNNPGHSMHSKRSRNRGQQHLRHNPGYHYSKYNGKNNPSFDHHLPFKAGNSKWAPELVFNSEGRERAFHKPERIRLNETPMEVIPSEGDDNMLCGTCERLLRHKHPLGTGIINIEPSVVAVLVCGHFFHADCLEMRTKAEDASDPKCPLCFTH